MPDARSTTGLALEFRDVTVMFDDHAVLRDVSFRLPRGAMLVVTGTSGSGKTVMLHTAVGFIRPERGQVLVDGSPIEALAEDELLALRSREMGLVFQEDSLFSGMSVFDNAAFRLVEHDWPDDAVDRAVDEILRFVGLERDAEKLPEELSIGMRRRLEIARALIGWPSIMLFDEPTSGLDPMTSRRIMDLVIRARDVHGMSALYVTKELHDIPYLAGHFADEGAGGVTIRGGTLPDRPPTRVLLLKDGEVAFDGTPEAFRSSTLPAVLEMTDPGATRAGSDVPARAAPAPDGAAAVPTP